MSAPQCPTPLLGWKGPKGFTTNRHKAFDQNTRIQIPCGKCDICRFKKAREIGVRAYLESLDHQRNGYLTLSFDDEHLPEQVTHEEINHFIDNLSEMSGREKPIRHLACGEYGSEDYTARPHYHLITFGFDWLGGADRIGNSFHINRAVTMAWGKGHVQCNLFEPGAAFYVAGYVAKKFGDEDGFVTWTKTPPALGMHRAEKHKEDLMKGVIMIDGTAHPVPKSFRAKWPEVDEACKAKFREHEKMLKQNDPEAFWHRDHANQIRVMNLRNENGRRAELSKVKGAITNAHRAKQARRRTLGLTSDHFRSDKS